MIVQLAEWLPTQWNIIILSILKIKYRNNLIIGTQACAISVDAEQNALLWSTPFDILLIF